MGCRQGWDLRSWPKQTSNLLFGTHAIWVLRHNAGMPRRLGHHHVYVIELSARAWEVVSFRRANPGYRVGRPLVYVGMTGLDPDLRFDRHKAGIQSNRFARDFGLRLMPELYERYNPMTYEQACQVEVDLGIWLRSHGYGVWQA